MHSRRFLTCLHCAAPCTRCSSWQTQMQIYEDWSGCLISQLDAGCVDRYSNSRYSKLLSYCGVKPAASGPASSTSAPGGGGSSTSTTATPTASAVPTADQPPAPASQAGCRAKQVMQALLFAPSVCLAWLRKSCTQCLHAFACSYIPYEHAKPRSSLTVRTPALREAVSM